MIGLPASPRWFSFLAGLSVLLAGCTPMRVSELDEQKDPHFLTGKSRLHSMDYLGAIEAFEKALEANPRSASAHLELGLLYEQRMSNEHATAIYHYEKHLKLRPNSNVADSVRARILACKLDLAKTVSFSLVNRQVQAAMDKLDGENKALRKHVEELKTQIAHQNFLLATRAPSDSSEALRTAASTTGSSSPGPRAGKPTGSRPATAMRTHQVKRGENPSSIARQYGLSPSAILSANPGLNPKRLMPGQSIYIPAPNI